MIGGPSLVAVLFSDMECCAGGEGMRKAAPEEALMKTSEYGCCEMEGYGGPGSFTMLSIDIFALAAS